MNEPASRCESISHPPHLSFRPWRQETQPMTSNSVRAWRKISFSTFVSKDFFRPRVFVNSLILIITLHSKQHQKTDWSIKSELSPRTQRTDNISANMNAIRFFQARTKHSFRHLQSCPGTSSVFLYCFCIFIRSSRRVRATLPDLRLT